jgi:outer membrane autotransporter protein
LEPYLGLRYQWLSRDSFQESGAGSVNLIANSQDQHSLRLGAGLRVGRNFSMDNGWFIHPEIRTGWEHEFLDDHGSFTAQFAGTPVNISNFTVLGTRSSRDRAILSAGLSMEINPQIQLYADYSGWISSNEQVHGAIGGFRINW